MSIRKCWVMAILCLIAFHTAAQTENTGWLFISHSQKINQKFDVLADVQFRSSDQLSDFSALLLRTALNYNFNKHHAVAVGYAFLGKWEKDDSDLKVLNPENRIYQQYLFNTNTGLTEWSLRFRLEQRLITQESQTNFSQRARFFVAAQIPLLANEEFSKGLYTGVQNELFLNVINKNNVNGHTLDQNRSSVSLGYRWSKKIDTEFGYMFWAQKEDKDYSKTNIWQLMITTSF
ncbi:uncharacterized protein DUF2490 [Pedobacter psychrotolerans]|uniref:Uncharacterized protein DUF2490 n=2 Tax=Pedobacter psychrotolerans TaxID=1843235 RepID=A0A4R2HCG9_9SPHI|nr:DUF2490 domain-containing protein [Pedobacter psychrotolerans]TCO25468.1 uncharacterized protein DUF2490 [Pedobacter psychrotolerans]